MGWYTAVREGARRAPYGTIPGQRTPGNSNAAEPAITDHIRELGAEPMIMSPSELDAFVAAETKKWAAAVKFSGAKVD